MTKEKELAKSNGLLFYCACGRIKVIDKWLHVNELSEEEILNLEKAGRDGRITRVNTQCPKCASATISV